jgi:hypothetical protein
MYDFILFAEAINPKPFHDHMMHTMICNVQFILKYITHDAYHDLYCSIHIKILYYKQ